MPKAKQAIFYNKQGNEIIPICRPNCKICHGSGDVIRVERLPNGDEKRVAMICPKSRSYKVVQKLKPAPKKEKVEDRGEETKPEKGKDA